MLLLSGHGQVGPLTHSLHPPHFTCVLQIARQRIFPIGSERYLGVKLEAQLWIIHEYTRQALTRPLPTFEQRMKRHHPVVRITHWINAVALTVIGLWSNDLLPSAPKLIVWLALAMVNDCWTWVAGL